MLTVLPPGAPAATPAILPVERADPSPAASAAAPEPRLPAAVVAVLVNTMEAKDPYLLAHSQRASDLAASIADTLGLGAGDVEDVRLAARLQDLGMLGVPSEVLATPGPLGAAERRLVREHVRIGVEVLRPLSTTLGPVLRYVHEHHERPDGRGYPRALAGDAISLGGRILAAADAFDALTSRRPHREALTWEESLAVLSGVVGAALDPAVYDALVRVVTTRRILPYVDDVVPRCAGAA